MKKIIIIIPLILFLLVNNVSAKTNLDKMDKKIDMIKHYSEMILKNVTKKINVYGTEYQVGDTATIFLQLLADSQPLNNATCLIDLFYPDKTKWFDKACMIHLNDSDGIYYYDLIVPDKTGVYMLSVQCFYISDYTVDYADNTVVINGLESGSYQDTWKDDNIFHEVREKLVAGGYIFDFYYEFYNVTIPENVTGFGIYWIGRWDDETENVEIHVWDYCDNNWSEPLPNKISTNTPMVTNFISDNNLSCFIQNGTMKVEFHDHIPNEKITAGTFKTDFVEVQVYYLTYGQINDIRGSGELHVSQNIQDILLSMQNVIDPVETFCENDTLVTRTTRIYTINNRQINITDEERVDCVYGCVNNRCVYYPYETLFIILVLLVILYIVYVYAIKPHFLNRS